MADTDPSSLSKAILEWNVDNSRDRRTSVLRLLPPTNGSMRAPSWHYPGTHLHACTTLALPWDTPPCMHHTGTTLGHTSMHAPPWHYPGTHLEPSMYIGVYYRRTRNVPHLGLACLPRSMWYRSSSRRFPSSLEGPGGAWWLFNIHGTLQHSWAS